jgi:hypothetical protein
MRNPAPIEGFHASEYTRPQQVIALIDALESRRVPLIVLRESNEFLHVSGSPSDHLTPFRVYLIRNYQVVRKFSTGDDVWRRIEPLAPASFRNNPAEETESGVARHEAEIGSSIPKAPQ